jgi:hypothetical protein
MDPFDLLTKSSLHYFRRYSKTLLAVSTLLFFGLLGTPPAFALSLLTASVGNTQPQSTMHIAYHQPAEAVYDLALIKTLAAGQARQVVPLADVYYTITVRNQGTVESGSFVVRDQIPAGMSFMLAEGPGFSCEYANGVVLCNGQSIAPEDAATITLQLRVDTTSQAILLNWAEISSDSSVAYGGDHDSVADDNTGWDDDLSGAGQTPNDLVNNTNAIDYADSDDEDDNDYEEVLVVVAQPSNTPTLTPTSTPTTAITNTPTATPTPSPTVLPKAGLELSKLTNLQTVQRPTQLLLVTGTVVTWTYQLTNTSDLPLTNLVLVDDVEGAIACPATMLAPQAHMQCLHTGLVRPGIYTNTATVTATTAGGAVSPAFTIRQSATSFYTGSGGEVGDRVWFDQNGNGQQDEAADSGAAGVLVSLRSNVGEQRTTTTAGDGSYHFADLIPNRVYTLSFVAPAGYRFTLTNVGDNSSDSDVSPYGHSVFTAEVGSNLSLDAGLTRPVEIGDFVWYDQNYNGTQDGNETGVPGVLATLYDAASDQAVLVNNLPLTATTNANGRYRFTDLLPGDYYVKFDLNSLPAGYTVTKQNQGDDSSDSDANGISGKTLNTGFISSGTQNATLDLGLVRLVNLGDRVWLDSNNDGRLNNNEHGIDGVLIELYAASAGPGVGSAIKTTATTLGGYYNFADLLPGGYLVYIPLPPTDSPASSSATDAFDNNEDNDDNGSQSYAGGAVISPVIVLASGSEPSNDGDGSDGNLTVDFGFYNNRAGMRFSMATEQTRILATGSKAQVRYTLAYTNTGPGNAINVVLVTAIAAQSLFDAKNSSPGWSCLDGASEGAICTYAIGTVVAGAANTVRFATVTEDFAGFIGAITISNSARLAYRDQGGSPTPIELSSAVDVLVASSPTYLDETPEPDVIKPRLFLPLVIN